MSSSFLRADGTLNSRRERWRAGWLPAREQMIQAVQLQFDQPNAMNQPVATVAAPSVWAISMRQGLGLIVAAALAAGLLPFLFNWVMAARLGTVVPLAQLAQVGAEPIEADGPLWMLDETWRTLAGLSPAFFPGWIAAFLSALGEWINGPLRWLTGWLVYGLGVLLVAKVWGAPATLQRFYALTAYAALPMILTGLRPIPCLGVLAQIIAVVWMLAIYATSVRAVTGLNWGRTAIAVLLPGATVVLLAALALLATAATLFRMMLW